MLSIALTKGRLEKESVRMFERCGYGVEELKNKGRQLVFHDTVKDNRYFLVKAADSAVAFVMVAEGDVVGVSQMELLAVQEGAAGRIVHLQDQKSDEQQLCR